MVKSRRHRSRKRTRKHRGGLVSCMQKCRDDASKSGKLANVMKKEVKGLAAKPLVKQMSALNKYKAAAEKQKKIASKGAKDAKAAIAAAKKDATGPVRGIHALKATKGGKRKRMTKRKRKKRKSKKSRRKSRKSKRRRKSKVLIHVFRVFSVDAGQACRNYERYFGEF